MKQDWIKSLVGIALMGMCSMGAMAQNFKGKALGPAVNTEYDETMPRLTPDDGRLYFVRARHPENSGGRGGGQDIWYADRLPSGEWGPARNAGAPLNNNLHNAVGAIWDHGTSVLLANCYPGPGKAPSPGISRSVQVEGIWGAPQTLFALDLPHLEAGHFSFCAHETGGPIVLSMSSGPGAEEDLYVIVPKLSGGWSDPISLGAMINTAGFETGPFLSSDGRTLYFSSNGRGGLGNGDIFMAKRLDDTWTNWSEPMNLGPEVNTAGFDGHFIVDAQGGNAYFVSGSTPQALGDIYAIPIKEIAALAPPTSSSDTLRVFTRRDQPVPFSLEAYGVPNSRATLVFARSVDGNGRVQVARTSPHYTYWPSRGFAGRETIEILYCDPPDADQCQEIILVAEVEGVSSLVETVDTVYTMEVIEPPIMVETIDTPVVVVEVIEPPIVVEAIDTPTVVVEVIEPPIVVVEVIEPPIVVEAIDTPAIELPKDILISGRIIDARTGQPLEAEIKFYAQPGNTPLGSIYSDPLTGNYQLRLPIREGYSFEVAKQYYFPQSEAITPGKGTFKGEVRKDISLAPVPMETGTTFVLKDIYFDLDKSILKPESKAELQRLYNLLRDHPTMEIEIRGHTDNWSDDAYNLKLSENRAMAVVNYLKYMGIMGTRLSWKGYGETVPIATNETEEGRALNRRVEFVVVKQ